MSKDHKPERELWLLLLGACLVGADSRDAVLKAIAPEDFPDECLQGLAQALKSKDTAAMKLSLEGFGVRVNGKVLDSLIENGVARVFEKRAERELRKLEWIANGKAAGGDMEKALLDAQERIQKLLVTKGRTQ